MMEVALVREGIHSTANGEIHFWLSENIIRDRFTLVFLPGLTADHRLFERQIGYFQSRYNVLVWDAPGHAASWPFELSFSLMDEARWLEEILRAQGVEHPVLIGQSMGGYVAQAYCELYPDRIKGFVAIDSAPVCQPGRPRIPHAGRGDGSKPDVPHSLSGAAHLRRKGPRRIVHSV